VSAGTSATAATAAAVQGCRLVCGCTCQHLNGIQLRQQLQQHRSSSTAAAAAAQQQQHQSYWSRCTVSGPGDVNSTACLGGGWAGANGSSRREGWGDVCMVLLVAMLTSIVGGMGSLESGAGWVWVGSKTYSGLQGWELMVSTQGVVQGTGRVTSGLLSCQRHSQPQGPQALSWC
jgi:hypothetical protein